MNGSHPEEGLGGRDLSQRRGIRHRNAGFSLGSPESEQSDLYLTSGLQTMAISRKRKQPSAGSDLDQEESHQEDGRPSKKTVTSKYNIQSSKELPFPKSGPVPVVLVVMILYFGEQEQTVRALLDTGSTVPLLSLAMVEQHEIPIAERETKRTIQDYARQEVPGVGEFFTSPILLQHRHHYSRVSFEVAPLAGDYDIIIPRWWLAKHKCDLLASNGRIKFTSGECQRKCTREAKEMKFSLEWDTTIFSNPEAGILGMVAAAPADDDLKAAINKVPEVYSEFKPIMTAEMAEVLLEHSVYDHAIDLKEGTKPPWGPIVTARHSMMTKHQPWVTNRHSMTKHPSLRPPPRLPPRPTPNCPRWPLANTTCHSSHIAYRISTR